MGVRHSKPVPEKRMTPEDEAFQLSFYSHPYDPTKNSTESLASPTPSYNSKKPRFSRNAPALANPMADIERQQPSELPAKRKRLLVCLACKQNLPESKDEEEAPVGNKTCLFLFVCLLVGVLVIIFTATMPHSSRKQFKEHTRGIDGPRLQVVQVVNATNATEAKHGAPIWQPVVELKGKNGTTEWCEFGKAESLRTFPVERNGKLMRGVEVFVEHVEWFCNGTVVNEAWNAAERKG